MQVSEVRPQTSICAELVDRRSLYELLERCQAMGLRVVSLRRLSFPEALEHARRPDEA